jgi:hypothetical protein
MSDEIFFSSFFPLLYFKYVGCKNSHVLASKGVISTKLYKYTIYELMYTLPALLCLSFFRKNMHIVGALDTIIIVGDLRGKTTLWLVGRS